MDSIQIKYLKQLRTISAMSTLISFCLLAERERSLTIKYAMNDIANDSKLSSNTVRRAIEELVELKMVEVIVMGRGSNTSVYKLLIEVSDLRPQEVEAPKVEAPKSDTLEWKKAASAKEKKASQDSEIINNIENIDFNNINLLKEDINSLTILNSNLFMNDKELGKLANRVMKEVFLPATTGTKPSYWFPQQMKLMKDLLVQWRTEQVVAAIRYWTEIKPPASGITSLKFLMWKSKGTSNIMHGLDYYKQQYLANASELNKEKHEQLIAETLRSVAAEQERKEEEKKAVDTMTDDDFLKKMFGG